jgi:hypothetical protein
VTHRCARPGCGREIPRNKFACKPCWLTLPQVIREDINVGWRTRRRTGNPLDHRAATLEAQRHWARQETPDERT